ncbi:protein of unknown function [Candidatus Nitrotoga arctica]|uniref:Uncharacterized protein n=1 Tax=Candidatus Nitrotoga arctica TaxID=453162 RepID=A0ABM8YZV2_9PROT|nr:protein of unknown function [Candidatus Nitrotoga arctica]
MTSANMLLMDSAFIEKEDDPSLLITLAASRGLLPSNH